MTVGAAMIGSEGEVPGDESEAEREARFLSAYREAAADGHHEGMCGDSKSFAAMCEYGPVNSFVSSSESSNARSSS